MLVLATARSWGADTPDFAFELTGCNRPGSAAIDATGHFYVTDSSNHRIRKYDPGGRWLADWGRNGGEGSSGTDNREFHYPIALAVDAAGNLYVTDGYNNRVQKLDANGNFLGSWGTLGAGNGQFRFPYGIAIDSSGNIYVAEYTGHRIQKFDAGMNYLTQWPVDPPGFEVGAMLAVDEADRIYVATDSSHKIRKYSSSGERLAVWGGSASSNDGLFNNPIGLAADRAGCLFVADRLNHRIQKLTTDGVFVAKWGTAGSGAGQLDNPFGVAVGGGGRTVCVADYGNNRAQVFTFHGVNTAAPVLDHALTPVCLDTAAGGDPPAGPVGTPVASLVNIAAPPANVSDSDPGTVAGVAITASDTAHGTWHFSTDNGATWTALSAPSESNARLLAGWYGCRVFFQAAPGFFGTVPAALAFRAWDGSAGTSGGTADTTVNGGSSAFSTATDTAAITVVAPPVFAFKFGGPGTGNRQFSYPTGLALDDRGDLFVCDAGNRLVKKFSSGGDFLASLGSGSLAAAWDVAAAADGDVWAVCDGWTVARKYRAGVAGHLAEIAGFVGANGIAAGAAGNILVADSRGHCVRTCSAAGAIVATWGAGQGSDGSQFNSPMDVACDHGGNCYVADQGNSRIVKRTSSGSVAAVWGGPGTAAGRFLTVRAVAVDAAGRVYVCDEGDGNDRVQVFNGSGSFLVQWGGSGSGDQQFNMPMGVAVRPDGRVIYVGDYLSHEIRVFTYNSAPLLESAATPALLPVPVDADPPSGPVGTPVTRLVAMVGAPANVADADAGAVSGVAITAADATHGSWYFSTDRGATWSLLGTPAAGSARLLAATAEHLIAFQPAPGFHAVVSSALTFRAWDQTYGADGGLADTSVYVGGATAFSTGVDSADLAVTTPPLAAPDNVSAIIGQARLIGVSELLANDTDGDHDPLSLTGVSGPSAEGGTVSMAAGVISYTPPVGFSGTDSFTYTVDDGFGGSATGTVVVTVSAAAEPSARIVAILPVAGGYRVCWTGTVGQAYHLQRSGDLLGWDNLTPVPRVMPVGGSDEFDDRPTPLPRASFYRIRQP